ncbi:DUF7674 family protein [Sphingobacterium puteale]|uniref:DUF7674 family protein n=1 Tax=Sphingobacterium puteale TaxID=2420510 RepID=UPI003D977A20
MKGKNLFINELVELFPSLEEELLDEDNSDSITFQMGTFRRFMQAAIDENDRSKFNSMVYFLTKNLPLVDKRIQNAIYINFLGKLDFSKNPSLRKLLGGSLGKAYSDIENYHNYRPY